MSHEPYGCACCSGDFGRIFSYNQSAQQLAKMDPATGFPYSPTLSRRSVMASSFIVGLGGKTVLPGFIDPHTHVVAGSVVEDNRRAEMRQQQPAGGRPARS
jgi:hypothetical protein